MFSSLSSALEAFSLATDQQTRLQAQRFIKSSAIGRFFPLNWLEDNLPQVPLTQKANIPPQEGGAREAEAATPEVDRITNRQEVHGFARHMDMQRKRGQAFLKKQIPEIPSDIEAKTVAMWQTLKTVVTEGLSTPSNNNTPTLLIHSLDTLKTLLGKTNPQVTAQLKATMLASKVSEDTITRQDVDESETSILINDELQQKIDLLDGILQQTQIQNTDRNESIDETKSYLDSRELKQAQQHLEILYTRTVCSMMCDHFIHSQSRLTQKNAQESTLGFLFYTFAQQDDGTYLDNARIITAIEECKNNFTASTGNSVSCINGFIQRLEILGYTLAESQHHEPGESSPLLKLSQQVAETYLGAQASYDNDSNIVLPSHLEHLLVTTISESKSATRIYNPLNSKGFLNQQARNQSKSFCDNLNEGISQYLEVGDETLLRSLIPVIINHMASIVHLMDINEEFARCVLWLSAHHSQSAIESFLPLWGGLIARSVHYFESSETIGTPKTHPSWQKLEKEIQNKWRDDNAKASSKLLHSLALTIQEINHHLDPETNTAAEINAVSPTGCTVIPTQSRFFLSRTNRRSINIPEDRGQRWDTNIPEYIKGIIETRMQDFATCACLPHIPPVHDQTILKKWHTALENLALLTITTPSKSQLSLYFGDTVWEKTHLSQALSHNNDSIAWLIRNNQAPMQCELTWALEKQRFDIIEQIQPKDFHLYLKKLEHNLQLQNALQQNSQGIEYLVKRIIDLLMSDSTPTGEFTPSEALLTIQNFVYQKECPECYQVFLDRLQHYGLHITNNPITKKLNATFYANQNKIESANQVVKIRTIQSQEQTWYANRPALKDIAAPLWQSHLEKTLSATNLLAMAPCEFGSSALTAIWLNHQMDYPNQNPKVNMAHRQWALVHALSTGNLNTCRLIIENSEVWPAENPPCARTWGYFISLANNAANIDHNSPCPQLLETRAQCLMLIMWKLPKTTHDILSGLYQEDMSIHYEKTHAITEQLNMATLLSLIPEPQYYYRLASMNLLDFNQARPQPGRNKLTLHSEPVEIFHTQLPAMINQLSVPHEQSPWPIDDIWFNQKSPLYNQAPKITNIACRRFFLATHSYTILETLLTRILTCSISGNFVTQAHTPLKTINSMHEAFTTLATEIIKHTSESSEYNTCKLRQNLTSLEKTNPIVFAIQHCRYDMANLLFRALSPDDRLADCVHTTAIVSQVFTDCRDATFWRNHPQHDNHSVENILTQHTPVLTRSLCEKLLQHVKTEVFITPNAQGKSPLQQSMEIHGLDNPDYQSIWQITISKIAPLNTPEAIAALESILDQLVLFANPSLVQLTTLLIQTLPTTHLEQPKYGYNLASALVKHNHKAALLQLCQRVSPACLRQKGDDGRTLLDLANIRNHWHCALILQNFCHPNTPINDQIIYDNPMIVLDAYEELAQESSQSFSTSLKKNDKNNQPKPHILAPILNPTLDNAPDNLLSAQNTNGDTLLHIALRQQDWHRAQKIIQMSPGEALILENKQGLSPLTSILKQQAPDITTGVQLIQKLHQHSLLINQAPTPNDTDTQTALGCALRLTLAPDSCQSSREDGFFGGKKSPSIPNLILWMRANPEPYRTALQTKLKTFTLNDNNHRAFFQLAHACCEVNDREGLALLMQRHQELHQQANPDSRPRYLEPLVTIHELVANDHECYESNLLMAAAKNGHTALVMLLLTSMQDLDLDIAHHTFLSPLDWAISKKHYDTASCLIQHYDNNNTDHINELFKLLNILCDSIGRSQEQEGLIEKILSSKNEVITLIGNPEPKRQQHSFFSDTAKNTSSTGMSGLKSYLCQQKPGLLAQLIKICVLKQKNGATQTLLTLSKQQGEEWMASLFGCIDDNGDTLLHSAVKAQYAEGLDILLSECPPERLMTGNANGLSALHLSCKLNYTLCTQALLRYTAPKTWLQVDTNNESPFSLACKHGNLAVSRAIVDNIPLEDPSANAILTQCQHIVQTTYEKADQGAQQHYPHLISVLQQKIESITQNSSNGSRALTPCTIA